MKWSKIAMMMGGRSGKQIRDRYLNNLNPQIADKDWTAEEDNMLLFLYYNWGKKWSKIAASLPGRSEGQVKNRFYWGLKRKVLNSDFADQNPIQIVTNHNSNNNGLYSEFMKNFAPIPNLNLGQSNTSTFDPKILFDYPIEENNQEPEEEQKVEINIPAISPIKQRVKPENIHELNPDDFISYKEAAIEQPNYGRFVNNNSMSN